MKVVHIVFETPKPSGSGAVLRNHGLLLSLQRQGETSTITVQDYFATGKKHPIRKRSFIEAALPEDIVADIVQRVSIAKPDLVLVEGVYLADIAYALIDRGFRTIIDMHNVESQLLKETDISKKPCRARIFYNGRWARAGKAEADLAASANGIWVCSKADANRLGRIMAADNSISIVPNPIPNWCLDADPIKIQPGTRALFVGHLGYHPNIRAVKRLVNGIHPAIRGKLPSATLGICGRAPGKKLRKLVQSAPHVKLVINPQDLSPIYAQATVAIMPLDTGGGTRLKVLEALALGLPIVASAKAVEGLNMVEGETYLAASSDAEFADCVYRLAIDEDLRSRMIKNGQNFVHNHHGSKAMDNAVLAALSIRA